MHGMSDTMYNIMSLVHCVVLVRCHKYHIVRKLYIFRYSVADASHYCCSTVLACVDHYSIIPSCRSDTNGKQECITIHQELLVVFKLSVNRAF